MDDLAARLHVHQPAAPHLLVGSGLQQRLDVTVRKASAALLMTRSDRRRAGADGVRCFDAPDSGRRGTPPWPARHSLRSPGSHGPHEQMPNKWLMVMSRGRHGALKLRCCDPDAAAPNLREPPAAWRTRRAHAERTPNDARPRPRSAPHEPDPRGALEPDQGEMRDRPAPANARRSPTVAWTA